MVEKIKTKHLKNALTLIELMIVMVLVPLLVAACMHFLRPNDIKQDAMNKAGRLFYADLSIATMNIMTKYSKQLNLTGLNTADKSSRFELTDDGAEDNLLDLYKTVLKISREASTLTYSDFTGTYKARNGAYFAIKLYDNCTTSTVTYNPQYEDAMEEYNTCGAIFYDINDIEEPNEFGVDRYIVALDKQGLR